MDALSDNAAPSAAGIVVRPADTQKSRPNLAPHQHRALTKQARRAYKNNDITGLRTALEAGLDAASLLVPDSQFSFLFDDFSERNVPLVDAIVQDGKNSWLREVWEHGARPSSKVAHPILYAVNRADHEMLLFVLDCDPSSIFKVLRGGKIMGSHARCAVYGDALENAVVGGHVEMVKTLVKRTESELDGVYREAALKSLRGATAEATHPKIAEILQSAWVRANSSVAVEVSSPKNSENFSVHDPVKIATCPGPITEHDAMILAHSHDLPEFARMLLRQIDALKNRVESLESVHEKLDAIGARLGERANRPAEPAPRLALWRRGSREDEELVGPLEAGDMMQ